MRKRPDVLNEFHPSVEGDPHRDIYEWIERLESALTPDLDIRYRNMILSDIEDAHFNIFLTNPDGSDRDLSRQEIRLAADIAEERMRKMNERNAEVKEMIERGEIEPWP